jgi:WD40 repeat protein/tetratricopeptide (TPR) repeat protein
VLVALYSAFVSYSHAADGKLAPAVQHALHAFAKPWYKLRSLRVFRDKTSLSATPGLWPSIQQALSQSEWFLYMASPQAAQSSWVQQEIAWWIEHRSCEKMLILLTDGDVFWDTAANDFEWQRTSAAPPLLKGRFPSEPLYVDLRWARNEENLSLRHSQFRAAMLDIAAPIHGRAKDELDGDDVRQQRKNKRWAWSAGIALGILAVVATLAAVVAVRQRDQAEIRRQVALSRQMATQAVNYLGEERLDSALLLALESRNALTLAPAASDVNTFDARSSLLTALEHGAMPIRSYLHGGNVVAFSPDGKTLASGSAKQIVLWDMRTRQPAGRPMASHGDAVFAIAFSPDGKLLASASRSERNLTLWSVEKHSSDGQPLTVNDGSAITVAFSPDGKTFVTGGGDKNVFLWDLATRQPIGKPLSGHTSNVVSMAFSPDGRTLASGSWDGTVILWNVETQVPLGPPLDVHTSLGQAFGQVESVAFSANGKLLAAGGGGGVALWSVDTGKPVSPLLSHLGSGVHSVAFSPDGMYLASGSSVSPGTVILWNVETHEQARPPLRGHAKWIETVAFSPDGKTLASSGGDDTVILWNIESPHRLAAKVPGYEGEANTVAISRDGRVVAAGICIESDTSREKKECRQAGIRLWDSATKRELRTFRTGRQWAPTSLVFVDSSSTLLSSSCDQGGRGDCRGIEVEAWDTCTGQVKHYSIHDNRSKIASMVLSPDGKVVAAGSCKSVGETSMDCDAGEIRLYAIESGRQIHAPLIGHGRGIDGLAFSPDGQTLASSTLDDVIEWNVSKGSRRGRPQPGSSVAFTQDGKIIAVAAPPVSSPPRSITLNDTSTNQRIGELPLGEDDVVLTMAFDPGGKLLAVSLVDANGAPAVSLWDVARRERLGQPLRSRAGRVFALAFSPDGKTLVSGTEDQGVLWWDVDPESWRERACAVANRNLTYEEWAQVWGDEPYRATCPALPPDPSLIEAGRKRARSGDIDGAVAIFRRARQLFPALQLDPKREATRFSVEELIADGKYLAASGDVEGGTASFEKARKLDPRLPLDPVAEARKLAAPLLLEQAEALAAKGSITESIAEFARVHEFDPSLQVPATAWNALCWEGSLRGRAADVMDACERAVASDPRDGRFHTSRGLARALTRKGDEAITDFEAFLAWAANRKFIRMGMSERHRLDAERLRHEQWIAALRAGQDPFTPPELKKLLEAESAP